MVQFLKDIYLTTFAIFYRIGGWGPRTNAAISAVVIALIESFVLITVLPDISKMLFLVIYSGLYAVNLYLLVLRGHGIKFQKEFSHFRTSKKVLLTVASLVTILAAIAYFIFAARAHRRMLGIHD
jgi:TctA family transporter